MLSSHEQIMSGLQPNPEFGGRYIGDQVIKHTRTGLSVYYVFTGDFDLFHYLFVNNCDQVLLKIVKIFHKS